MNGIKETCGCGAVWEGDSAYASDRARFREAHVPCRTAPSPSGLEQLLTWVEEQGWSEAEGAREEDAASEREAAAKHVAARAALAAVANEIKRLREGEGK
jgi:hypothetical protein